MTKKTVIYIDYGNFPPLVAPHRGDSNLPERIQLHINQGFYPGQRLKEPYNNCIIILFPSLSLHHHVHCLSTANHHIDKTLLFEQIHVHLNFDGYRSLQAACSRLRLNI
jgi:hypothetical protein